MCRDVCSRVCSFRPPSHLFCVHPAGHLVNVQRSHVGRKLSNLHHGLHPAGLQPSKLSRKDGRIMAWPDTGLLDGGHRLFHICHQLGVIKNAARHLKKKHPQSQSDRQLADLAVPGNDHHGGARPSGGWTPFFLAKVRKKFCNQAVEPPQNKTPKKSARFTGCYVPT